MLGAHFEPPRPACFDDMAQDVPKFIELYCQGEKAAKNAEQCTSLNKIQVDILRLKAQKLVERADKEGGREALALYEKGGAAYFEMFRKYCEDPVANNQPPQAEKCDEIVYNAARAFQAARLIAKAIAARKILLDLDEKLKLNSPLAKKATYEIGGNYQAIAVYDARGRLVRALREGGPEGARRRQGPRRRRHSPPRPRPGGPGDRGRADVHEELRRREARADGRDRVRDRRPLRREGGLGQGARARSPGRWASSTRPRRTSRSRRTRRSVACTSQAQGHGEAQAKGEYAKVRGLWNDPATAEAEDPCRVPDGGRRRAGSSSRRRRSTPSARRYFFVAEERRKAEVEIDQVPGVQGPGRQGRRSSSTSRPRSRTGTRRRSAAIEKVEPEYMKILELKPVPPPKWVIAAGSRVGLMWGKFVDEFRRAPIPAEWKTGRGAPRRLLRQPRRSERALQGPQREAGAQEVPRSARSSTSTSTSTRATARCGSRRTTSPSTTSSTSSAERPRSPTAVSTRRRRRSSPTARSGTRPQLLRRRPPCRRRKRAAERPKPKGGGKPASKPAGRKGGARPLPGGKKK